MKFCQFLVIFMKITFLTILSILVIFDHFATEFLYKPLFWDPPSGGGVDPLLDNSHFWRGQKWGPFLDPFLDPLFDRFLITFWTDFWHPYCTLTVYFMKQGVIFPTPVFDPILGPFLDPFLDPLEKVRKNDFSDFCWPTFQNLTFFPLFFGFLKKSVIFRNWPWEYHVGVIKVVKNRSKRGQKGGPKTPFFQDRKKWFPIPCPIKRWSIFGSAFFKNRDFSWNYHFFSLFFTFFQNVSNLFRYQLETLLLKVGQKGVILGGRQKGVILTPFIVFPNANWCHFLTDFWSDPVFSTFFHFFPLFLKNSWINFIYLISSIFIDPFKKGSKTGVPDGTPFWLFYRIFTPDHMSLFEHDIFRSCQFWTFLDFHGFWWFHDMSFY